MAKLAALLGGVLSGIVIGYGLGIMLAPYDGTASRARLQGQTRRLSEPSLELADRVRSRVELAVEEGKRAASEKRGELEASSGLDRELPESPSRQVPV